VIVAFSTALVLWARSRPSYDAYGWLVWGYQALHWNLDLGGAPSWKPLPFLFTVPYALLGLHLELRLWMVTAVSLAFAGCVFGGRIAFWIISRDLAGGGAAGRLERWAPWGAAVFAGAAVLGLQDYMHYILSVQSDPVIVSCVLAGIDFYLRGRLRAAFWAGMLAGLGRPEAWCLLAPLSLYLLVRKPSLRLMVVVGWALMLFMWFGIPTLTNDRPFVSAELAENSPRLLHGDRITGTLHRFWDLYDVPLWVAAGGTLIWAAVRRNLIVLGLGVGAALWVVTEVVFALHSWPGLPRYMFEGAAICGVIGGIGFGWLLLMPAELVRRAAFGSGSSLGAGARIARCAGPVLAAALIIWLLPYARIRYEQEHDDLLAQRVRTSVINSLESTFTRLGGVQHIHSCGQPVITVEWASALAFYMRMDVGFVGYRAKLMIVRRHNPIVLFDQIPNGWQVKPFHEPRGSTCRALRSDVVFTRSHPRGQILPVPL
jgi:hypothetical protein